ncbi:hypothetical protein F5Y18DRAFT_430657 [Xylariaceae sp. FL1019]|nr:hypothetical protein F5Y18DRAFT_430657 [Xylariaceae sp. FL1019]
MKFILLWSLVWSLQAVLTVSFPLPNEPPTPPPTPTISNNYTTSRLEVRQSSSPSPLPSPPAYDPMFDEPPDTWGYVPTIENHNNAHHYNAIPTRVLSRYRFSTNNNYERALTPIIYHQIQIFTSMMWGHFWLRQGLTSTLANPFHPTRFQNGRVYPIPFAAPRPLMRLNPLAGELDWENDPIFEFPIGPNGRVFGLNMNRQPGAGNNALPSDTFVVFGYHRWDVTFTSPIYIGVHTRVSETPRTDGEAPSPLQWCPVVNYDATSGPSVNSFGQPWTGVPENRRLIGPVWRALRDWLPAIPILKQPFGPRELEALDQVRNAVNISETENAVDNRSQLY